MKLLNNGTSQVVLKIRHIVVWNRFFYVQYLNEEEVFDGMSIITFTNEGKMVSVKEYQSSVLHVL
ncbi:MAG: hypothetical protein RSC10_03585 [Longicatena sp.]